MEYFNLVGVSVVLPTYNRAHCLERAVRSVDAQLWTDWELIVVDDGSTDDTESVCRSLKAQIGRRMEYIKVPNGGASKARNIGILMSSNDYIAFLDSDDYFYPEKLSMQLAMMERNPGAVLSFSNYSTFFGPGQIGVPYRIMPSTFNGWIYPSLLTITRNCIVTPSVLTKRRELILAGLFDTEMALCEDIDLWRRLARRGKVVRVDAPLLGVHVRRDQEFAYAANLAGRLNLYAKALREDAVLSPEFLHHLFLELFGAYKMLAAERGDFQQRGILEKAERKLIGRSLEWPMLEIICRDAISKLAVLSQALRVERPATAAASRPKERVPLTSEPEPIFTEEARLDSRSFDIEAERDELVAQLALWKRRFANES